MGAEVVSHARRPWAVLLISIALLASAPPALAAPVPATPDDLCAQQLAAVRSLEAQIEAHNSEPHEFVLPDQQAQLSAYDAEAEALNARKAPVLAQLQDCIDAMQSLQDAAGSPLGLAKPPADVQAALEQAKSQLPKNWSPPPPPPGNQNWKARGTPVGPLFDALRKDNPGEIGDIELQGAARPKIGDPDPAYPAGSGKLIGTNADGGSKVSPDHIIPLSQLVNLPGFTELTPEQMYALSRSPLNLQWMSASANLSKQSRSAALVSGADPQWVESQQALEQQTLQQLQDVIAKLVKLQGNGG